jgi:dynein heavy chain
LDRIKSEIEGFNEELENFVYFSKMFSFEELTEGSDKSLANIKAEHLIQYKVWNHITNCQTKFDEYLKMGFLNIDPNNMDDDVKKLRKGLTDIKGVDRKSGTYQGLNDEIKKWAIFLPLLAELIDPAMIVEDGRHWAKVKKTVGKEFVVD